MNCYLSTIAPDAQDTARRYSLGLEIAEYCTAWNMDEKFPETDTVVKEKLTGIESRVFHAPFNELFPCAIDPLARQLAAHRYRRAIRLARGYGAKKVIIHGGYNPWLYYPIWYKEQSIPFWQSFLKEVPQDMLIVLENVLEEDPRMLLDIIEKVNDPRLKMCLDVGHAHAYSKIPVMQWLECCAPAIGHFHIHNNRGDRDSHCALPDGTIPMKEFLNKALQLCPDASFTLEVMEAEPSVRWLMEEIWSFQT